MISVVIHTLNSGEFIQQCLESVKDFDEVIVCDMYSEDNTIDIANKYGAKVIMHDPCNGIVEPARTFAVNQVSMDWVFVVDSDEVVPEKLKKYLYKIAASDSSPDALFIPRKNYFMNKYMRAAFPDYQLRFFRKNKFTRWPVTIHSRPEIDGTIKKIPKDKSLAFIHLEKNEIRLFISKTNKYSDWEVERRKDKKYSVAGLIFQPAFLFFQLYVLKGGFRDGKEGFIYTSLRAIYKYITIAKMIERKRLKDQSKL